MLKSVNQRIALVLIAVSIFYLIFSYQLPSYPYIPVDADAIPKVLGWLLIVLAVFLFFAKDTDSDEQKAKRRIAKKDSMAIFTIMGMLFVYIFLLEIIGFVIMTGLFIFFSSWFLGYKKHVTNVIIAILFPVILYYIFNILLKINLPQGILPF